MSRRIRLPLAGVRGTAVAAALALAAAAPVLALDSVYLVRHAEKERPWPKEREADALRPLSTKGRERARALARTLEGRGVAAVYVSPTTRTLMTAMPLVEREGIPVHVERDTLAWSRMPDFLASLRERHADDRAVLIVGHANTVPKLLILLGAGRECRERLGISPRGDSWRISGYEGLWKVDLERQGCEGIVRRDQSR